MARRPDHPLHAALMNPIHPDHRHAVATYEGLFRDAYAPAGPGPKPSTRPGAMAKPGADGRKRPLSAPAGGGTSSSPLPASDPGFARRQRRDPDRDPPPIRLAQNEAAPEPGAAPTSRNFPIPGIKPESFETMMARDAARGAEEQDRHRWEQGHMLGEGQRIGGLFPPPATYITDEETYSKMLETARTAPNLSPYERNILMKTLTYEGAGYDAGGKSRGGIAQNGTWHHTIEGTKDPSEDRKELPLLQKIVAELRRIEGEDTPPFDDVKGFGIADIYEAMHAYMPQEFLPLTAETIGKSATLAQKLEEHHADHPLDAIGNLELAFQVFDTQFQYRPPTRTDIWNKALSAAIPEMYAALSASGASSSAFRNLQRAVFGIRTANADGTFAYSLRPRDRLKFAIAVGGSEKLAPILTRSLQRARAEWMHEENRNEYRGANRARIWGLVGAPAER
jgi:hypothetical protein